MMDDRVESVWREHATAVRRFVARRVGDEALAEDLTQEAYLRLLRLDGEWPASPRAWLLRVARNLVIDHYRTRRPTQPLPEWLPARQESGDAYAALEACLPPLLERLPAPYREALVQADLEGLPQRLLAERAGVSLSGAKSRVQRGRRLLERALHECCEFERGPRGGLVDFAPKRAGACVLSPSSSSQGRVHDEQERSEMKQVTIEWRHLEVEGETCDRCSDTGEELRQAIEGLNTECAAGGVRFALQETRLGAERLADSNAVLIDGRPLESLLAGAAVGSSDCPCCSELTDTADSVCRTLEVGGEVHEAISAALIRDAACVVADCCGPECGCS